MAFSGSHKNAGIGRGSKILIGTFDQGLRILQSWLENVGWNKGHTANSCAVT